MKLEAPYKCKYCKKEKDKIELCKYHKKQNKEASKKAINTLNNFFAKL